MGVVYAVVLALLALAFAIGLMSERRPVPIPAEPATEVIGVPGASAL